MTKVTDVKVVLLAAGLGARLKPITDRVPKCLVPIAGRPLLDYWCDAFVKADLKEVLVNTHHHRHQVTRYIQGVNQGGRLTIHEAYEPTLLGSAGTISANPEYVKGAEHCLIVYADNLSTVDLGSLIQYHRSHSDPFTMMLFRAQNPRACGIAGMDSSCRIVRFVEKPREPESNLANGGAYVVTATAYDEIAAMNAFDIGFDVLPKFVGRMRGWIWEGYHRDIGTLESLEKAHAAARELFPSHPGANKAAALPLAAR